MHDRRRALGLLGAAAFAGCAGRAAAAGPLVLDYEARLRRQLADPPPLVWPEVAKALDAATNAYRAGKGLSVLTPHADLALAARAHAADMARHSYFQHASPEGYDANVRVGLLARRFCGLSGENIVMRKGGAGLPGAKDFLDLWLSSEGHRRNMERTEYTHVGHGVVRAEDRSYAVAVFGRLMTTLAGDLPLRLKRGALAPALLAATPAFDRFQVSGPAGEAAQGPWPVRTPPSLQAGPWRLRPFLPEGGAHFEVLWGPIFVTEG